MLSKPNVIFRDVQASHTWIVISGWALAAESIVMPSTNSNMLFISDYDPYELAIVTYALAKV